MGYLRGKIVGPKADEPAGLRLGWNMASSFLTKFSGPPLKSMTVYISCESEIETQHYPSKQ